jgi:hypothetical protein
MVHVNSKGSSDDHVQHSELLGFWTLSVVRDSKYYQTHFRNWICFHPQVSGEDTYSDGSLKKRKPQSTIQARVHTLSH